MKKHFYSYLLGAILTAMLSVSGYAKEHNNYDHITKTFAKANNTDLSSQVVLSNFKVIRENGSEVNSETSYVSSGSFTYLLNFDWDLSNSHVTPGDYFEFQLSDNMTSSHTQSQNITVGDIIVGTVNSNKETNSVKVSFNENVSNMTNFHGNISIPITIPLKEGENVISNPDGTQTIIIYTYNPSGGVIDEILGKRGASRYTDYIEWYIYINRSAQDFGNSEVIIEDKVQTASGSFVSIIPNPYHHQYQTDKLYSFSLAEVKYLNKTSHNDPSIEEWVKHRETLDYIYRNGQRINRTFYNDTHIIPVFNTKEEYDAEIAKGNIYVAYAEIIDGGQSFRLHLGTNVGNRSFRLQYRTTLPEDNTTVLNRANILVDNKETLPYESLNGESPESSSIISEALIQRNIESITYADTKDKIIITKYDAESGIRLANAVFRLTYPDGTTSVELTTGANGTVQTGVLDAGTYTLTEITAPEGYALLKSPTKVEVVYNKATFVNIPNYQIGKEPAPAFCLIAPTENDDISLNTNFGITTLGRAGETAEDWPMLRKGGWVALESNSKPFVVTRTTSDKITNPENGMLIFDTTDKCLKLYDGTKWTCFSTPACPTK